MNPPEGPLLQAPYNTSQDVASNRSLVQVAKQAHPLAQRRPSANRIREHRNKRAREEVVVGKGAAPQVTQEGQIGRARERGKTLAQGEGERVDGLRGRLSSDIWHHGGLEHRRT